MNAMGTCERRMFIQYSQRNCIVHNGFIWFPARINKHFSTFSGDPVRSGLSLSIPQRLTLFGSARLLKPNLPANDNQNNSVVPILFLIFNEMIHPSCGAVKGIYGAGGLPMNAQQ